MRDKGAFLSALFALARRGYAMIPIVARFWKGGLAGGTLLLAAYWIVI
jgi:hypothetical protein